MNAEIAKLRKSKKLSEKFDYQPQRIDYLEMNNRIIELNTNINDLYRLQLRDNIDIDTFASKVAKNIDLILEMFDEMGIYPDYFYDAIIKMNIEYRKLVNNDSLRGNYHLFNEVSLSSKVAKTIREGMLEGYYQLEAYPKKDINDAFLEMIGFFEAFKIPYNINTNAQCKKVFNDICFNHHCIMDKLENSDDIYDDIECLCRLLFEYNAFFVALGIHPREYLGKNLPSKKK